MVSFGMSATSEWNRILFVRQDFTMSSASPSFYRFLDNSGYPAAGFVNYPLTCIAQLGVVARADVSNALFTSLWFHDEFLQSVEKVSKLQSALRKLHIITESIIEQHDRDLSSRLTSVVAIENRLWFQGWHHEVAGSVAELQRKRAATATTATNPAFTNTPASSTATSSTQQDEQKHANAASPQHAASSLFFEPIYNADHSKIMFDKGQSHLLLFVKSQRADLNYEVTRRFLEMAGCMPSASASAISSPQFVVAHTIGFRYLGGRDLTGFIDGSRNAGGSLRSASSSLVAADAQSSATGSKGGGSFVLASRFVHDLPLFDSLDIEAKSNLMGRDYGRAQKATLAYAPDGRVENPLLEAEPDDCHIQRANTAFGSIYRQSFPYLNDSGHHGLFFIAFASNPFVFQDRLCSMAGHIGFGSHDKLLNVTKPVSADIYYAPSLLELSELAAN